ncbi:metallophosphoesterase family protein [Caenimonas koreensis]|uniref:metallophosphoesterase family protein n=1 Tax=Caenimonas koreensis TaxID=367474 RepID=UPI00378456EE
MKLALLSDIHANMRAFDACLAHAASQGATHYALLGDLVGYGAEPAEVVARAMALAREQAVVLQGNHDALAVSPPATTATMEDATAAWTHAQLDASQRAFLSQLPLRHASGDVLLVHASADDPAAWHYVDNAHRAQASLASAGEGVRHVFVGHVHHQRVSRCPCPRTASGRRRSARSASRAMARRLRCTPSGTARHRRSRFTACPMTT